MPRRRGTMKNQCKILEALRIRPLCFREIADMIFSGDRNTANRNLQALMTKGYVKKTRKGHKMMYSTNQKNLTDIEKQMILKKLLEQPLWHETEEGKEWMKKLPPEYFEPSSFEEGEKLFDEYRNEMKLLSEMWPDLYQGWSSGERIGWAKELRIMNKEKKYKDRTLGLREPRVPRVRVKKKRRKID